MATKKTTLLQPAPADHEAESRALDVAPAALWSNVTDASDLASLDRIKLLLYGPSGAGKSRLGAKFGVRPLIGLTEIQAVPTIRRHNPKARIKLIKSPKDLHEFRVLCADPDIAQHCDAVVLDSGTDAQRILRGYYTRRQGQAAGTEKTSMESWGLTIDATAKFMRDLRDLPVNVAVMFLDSEIEVAGEGLVHRPSVAGKKLPQDLAQYFNAVGYVHKTEQPGGLRHQVMFRGPDRWMSKGMEGLNDVEAPEPISWFMRVGQTVDLAEAELADRRVAAWRALETEGSMGDPSTDSDESPGDDTPFGPAAG